MTCANGATGSPSEARRERHSAAFVFLDRAPRFFERNQRRSAPRLRAQAGARWRGARARFPDRYRPVPPTVAGQAGRYVSLPNNIMAVPMAERFEVLLADGISRLMGRAGEWLVDYGDGSLGVVSEDIFAATYDIID